MTPSPNILVLDTVTAAADNDAALFPVRLWDYGASSDISAETVLVIHGRQGGLPQREKPLSELYPRLAQLASQLAAQGRRVLFLDWGEAAADDLPPFDSAERIKPVADWAADQIQSLGLSALTIVGHSLGSYVAAEVAQTLAIADQITPTPQVNLVALDPAFPAQNYDVDGLTEGQQSVANFSVASASLGFVAEDDIFQTGLAGDNAQAGTADTSFVVALAGLQGLLDAATAHGAVIDVYRDFERYLPPDDLATDWVLAQFPRDRIGNGGGRSADGLHEGVVEASEVDGLWRIAGIEGAGVALHAIDRFADGPSIPSDSDQLDIVAALVSLQLPANAEHLILGGAADLEGSGNAADNRLYGNRGNNRLRGRTGHDQIYGRTGDDDLIGNRGKDTLLGQSGSDRLWGRLGDDLLIGGAGADALVGGEGDDHLQGGLGTDHLQGGTGQDWFFLDALTGIDVIQDFQDGIDRLVMPSGVLTASVEAAALGGNTILTLGGEAIALLNNTAAAQIDAVDFISADALVA